MSLCLKDYATLIIDTGSDISLLKLFVAEDDAPIDVSAKVEIRGVTDQIIQTYGLCESSMEIKR